MMGNANTANESQTSRTESQENASESVQQGPIRNQPKLIISDYELNPKIVQAGEDFDLSFTLYNTNNENTIYNLKVTLEQTLAQAPQS